MGGEIDRIGAGETAGMLQWWLDAGVDVAIDERPRDWMRPAPAAPPAASHTIAVPDAEFPETLPLFRDWLGRAPALPLSSKGAKRVLPHGSEGAPVMLLAEMPSSEDAAESRPIAGAAWQLMERMLAAIGFQAEDAYAASLSCFHAPGTKMNAEELDACAAIARRHIALARPKRLLLLGDAPARALLGKPLPAARSHAHKIEGVRTVVTFHPRHLLNRPSDKALAWRDLLLLLEDEG